MPRRNQIDKSICNTVIGTYYVTEDFYIDRESTKKPRTFMKCVCVNCGKEKYIDKHTLIKTHNVICECSKEVSRRKTRLYHLYHGIKQRCYNPKDKKYPLYGGKGIKMCDEWLNDYELFRIWALENGYNDSLTIDRIDSSKDYCPENCQWITRSENSAKANKGRHKNYSKLGDLIAIKEDTAYIFDNITLFALEHGLTPAGIRNCVLEIGFKNHTYKDWKFYIYKDIDSNILSGVTTIENITTKKSCSE